MAIHALRSEPPAEMSPRPERWRLVTFFDDETNEVFVPAAIAGNEEAVFLCASFAGCGLIHDDSHLYVPASWLKREYPDTAPVCDLIRTKVAKFVAGGGIPAGE